jgi:8-oxo-dGTP diphosphatase
MSCRHSAFVIVVQSDHVLIVKARNKGHWQLPGGRIKPGETPVEAVVREVREETGLRARVGALTGTYQREDGSLARVYAATASGKLMGARREIVQQRWVRISEAKKMVSETTRRRLVRGLALMVSLSRRQGAAI